MKKLSCRDIYSLILEEKKPIFDVMPKVMHIYCFCILHCITLQAGAQFYRHDTIPGNGYIMTNFPDLLRLQPSITIGTLLKPRYADTTGLPRQHFMELSTTYIPWGYLISVIELNRFDVMDHVVATRLVYKKVKHNRHYISPVLSGRFGFYTLSERREENDFVLTGNRYYASAQQYGLGLGFQAGKHVYRKQHISDLYWGFSLLVTYTVKTVHWEDNGRTIVVYDNPQYIEKFAAVPQVFLGWRFGRVLQPRYTNW